MNDTNNTNNTNNTNVTIEDSFDYVLFSAPYVKYLGEKDFGERLFNWAEGFMNVILTHIDGEYKKYEKYDRFQVYLDEINRSAEESERIDKSNEELFEAIAENNPDINKNSSVLLDCSFKYATSAAMKVLDDAWNVGGRMGRKGRKSWATELTDEYMIEIEKDGKTIKVLVFQI